MDAGHYVRREMLRTRWDERNVNPQCTVCNKNREGSKPAYTLHLIREHGPDVIDELVSLGNTPKQWRLPELKDLAKWLRPRVKELEKTNA
jgi:hypothetical protein